MLVPAGARWEGDSGLHHSPRLCVYLLSDRQWASYPDTPSLGSRGWRGGGGGFWSLHRRIFTRPSSFPFRGPVTSTWLIWIPWTIQMSPKDHPLSIVSPFLLSLPGHPSGANILSDRWLLVRPGFIGLCVLGVYQQHLCLCIILKSFWGQSWLTSRCSWWRHSRPSLTALSSRMRWAQALSTSHYLLSK